MAVRVAEHGTRTKPRVRRVARRVALRRRATVAVGLAALTAGIVLAIQMLPGGRGARTIRDSPRSSVVGQSVAAVRFPAPKALHPFGNATPDEGRWRRAGRLVRGHPAVYETTIGLPDNPAVLAGVAWMDTKLLRARLYSGSLSPGGLFWRYTAPVSPALARTLVAAFNGGFLLNVSGGGYLSEGHLVAPLRVGAASLVIYADGSSTVGEWGRDASMSPRVVAVRQNLTLLVDHGRPVPGLNPADYSAWGYSLGKIANQWRSGLGVTADGALVYVAGQMNIVDLAKVLARAGAVHAMTLDMNPLWTVFATYAPAGANGVASASNGTDLLPTMYQTPARFFQPTYSRDFVTMSAR